MRRSSVKIKGIRFALSFSLLILALAAWYGWMSYTTSKTKWIEAKVQQAMSASMENLSPGWPRIETHVAGEVYYAPIVNDPVQDFQLTRHVLEILNQDVSVPPVKITQVSIRDNFGSGGDILSSQAMVEFPLFAGIDKTIMVEATVTIPHYKSKG
jgi:hypothetical protein